VRAFDAATGERRWARRTGGGGVLPPPVVGDGRVYALNADAIHAFTADGDRVWSRPTDGSRYLVGDGETLYAGGYAGADVDEGAPAGLVVAHDAGDGRERWRHLTRGYRDERGGDVRAGTEAPLAVADGVVFAATGAGDVYAFA
jgi:outer membrane protein assembly factor BamB